MDRIINIVYYVWINPNRNYNIIIDGQLNDLIVSGILERSKLFIVICCEHNHLINYINNIVQTKLGSISNIEYSIKYTNVNNFEYAGIKKVYDLALQEPDKLYIYMHSKGMLNYDYPHHRTASNEYLTRTLISMWKDIITTFNLNPNFLKMGMFPAKTNWIWFNFWWARGTYLNTCEDPIITDYRYYYESWVGTGNNSIGQTYNFNEGNFNSYTAEEALERFMK